ncbi:diacylglycerol/polyprenol kinase family protein [Acetivibrio straminisolvens]|jgi:dolichol kinase|uniref:Phytol kinase n=1 Tax=Acetivibrio straminisolvens JCM 21531 TaxID=1294263 RepID=W4V7W6_9FIRM|nr:phosphatidate cytidylyltransferase [Acetivibrio straminisolvens]GAE88839.1 phytol kinase [Acetivibrio straminisolvens JCM 21531]
MFLEFIKGYGMLLSYFAVCASSALVLRRFVPMPDELFRKILHMILLGSIFGWIYAFETWWVSAIAAIVFILMVFPILAFAERIPGYSKLLIERKKGEIKRSLIVVFVMFAILICLCWGWLGERYLVLASVLAWGLGDAAAALVGKRFGRHFIRGRLVEGCKSLEGTFAMFVVSFISVMIVLMVHGKVVRYACIPISAATSAVCAVVELYTKNGMDTLTCPLAAAAVLIPLVQLWGV